MDTDPTPPAAVPLAPANEPLPPGTPWWAILARRDIAAASRWAGARLALARAKWPLILAAGCEIYAQYGDQFAALIPITWRPHAAAALCIAGVLWRVFFSKDQK